MNTWLDGGFATVLSYVTGMQVYFLAQTKTVAMICFALQLGISSVKLAMGATELLKEMTKIFISVVSYFIIIWAFPLIMSQAQAMVGEMAYSAIFKNGIEIDLNGMEYGSEDKFYEWMSYHGQGVFVSKDAYTAGNADTVNIKKALTLNITNTKTGLISINKVMKLIIVGFEAVFKSSTAGIQGLGTFIKAIPDMIMALIVGFVFLACMVMCCIQYITGTIEYSFLMAVGVFFIPMMLWDGSKFIFEKLIGSFINITVKLMIITIALYLASLGIIEILKNMYILTEGKTSGINPIEFYVTVFFESIMFKMICDSAPTIAEFLCGGSPRLSFGEFAQAAHNVGNTASSVGGGAARVAGAGAGAAIGGASAAMQNGMNAAGNAKAAGGGAGAQVMAGLATGGTSLAKSLGHGMGDMAKAAVGGGKGIASNLESMISPGKPLSAEGVGGGFGGGGGGFGGGGKSNERLNGDGSRQSDGRFEGDSKLMSSSNSTRVEGAMQNYQARAATGNYSGIRGSLRNGIQSFSELNHANNYSNNPTQDHSKAPNNRISPEHNKG